MPVLMSADKHRKMGLFFSTTAIKELKLLQANDCLDILLSQVYDYEGIFFRLMSLRFVLLNKFFIQWDYLSATLCMK